MSNSPYHPKLGNRQPEWKIQFIRKNCENMTAGEISRKIQVSLALVIGYCVNNNLKLKKMFPDRAHGHGGPKGPRLVIADPPKKPLVRPPAKYDNRSWEEVIDHYLKLEI